MYLELSTECASLQFGITIRAWSLIFAAEAFVSSRNALKAMDVIALRCRQNDLRVHTSSPRAHRSSGHNASDPAIIGIAGIPLALLLLFRETIIDSALYDAERKHLNQVKIAHEQYNGSQGHSFAHCLRSARRGHEEFIQFFLL
ncbi:hypothetical protein K439DRAFT_1627041 [Ramaria rubella]|nr:hypothetical protein K439DRAFT_1627041 [Ramaria rubella]